MRTAAPLPPADDLAWGRMGRSPSELLRRHATQTVALAVALVAAGAAVAATPASAAGTWPWPVEGRVLTPYDFGGDPYAAGQHRGIDIAAPVGEPVAAATAGRVTFAGTAASAGLTVSVRTADGSFDTSYLHFDSISVEEGDRVEPGTELGEVGTSGERSAAAPHLHFGVRDAGERHAYRDPLLFLAPTGTPAPAPPPAPLPVRREPGPVPDPLPRPLPGPAPVPALKGDPVRERFPAHEPALSPRGAPIGAPGGELDLGRILGWAGLALAAATLVVPVAVRRRRATAARRRRAARAEAGPGAAVPAASERPPPSQRAAAREAAAGSIAPWPTTSPRRSTT